MSDEEQAQYNQLARVKFNPASGFEFDDLDGMFRAAQCYLQSGLAPTSFKTAQQLIICWAYAAELGLRPFQAIAGISVINNRIGIMGDLALAMVRNSGKMVGSPKVKHSGEGDALKCEVTIQRKDSEPKTFSYSVRQAKQASIYKNVWPFYPERMTYYRALGFALRDEFSDILKGMYITEELQDLADSENLAADKADVRFVDADKTEQAAQPPSEPPAQDLPPLEAQLTREHPDVAVKKEEKLMGPGADFAEAQAQARAATQVPEASAVPDDIDLGPVEPEKPWWVEHKIQGVKSLLGRTVQSLNATEMAAIESRLIPTYHARIAEATDAQRKDLEAFEARVAHDKTAKPW